MSKPKTVGVVSRLDSQGHSHTFLLQVQPPSKCQLCGAFEELRPYGPNGENICFACGEKNPEARDRQFQKIAKQALGYEL